MKIQQKLRMLFCYILGMWTGDSRLLNWRSFCVVLPLFDLAVDRALLGPVPPLVPAPWFVSIACMTSLCSWYCAKASPSCKYNLFLEGGFLKEFIMPFTQRELQDIPKMLQKVKLETLFGVTMLISPPMPLSTPGDGISTDIGLYSAERAFNLQIFFKKILNFLPKQIKTYG